MGPAIPGAMAGRAGRPADARPGGQAWPASARVGRTRADNIGADSSRADNSAADNSGADWARGVAGVHPPVADRRQPLRTEGADGIARGGVVVCAAA